MSLATQAHFGNYGPANFGWGARDPENDSSLLVPFRHSGVNFGSMHRDVVGVFTNVLNELVPLIPGGLIAGTCGCYNPKSVTVGGDRSFHTFAIAIDVNWHKNPMGVPSRPTGTGALPAATSQIARKWGCEWGGDWTNPKDWMHIECHLTPQVARAVKAVPTKEEFVQLDKEDRDWLLANLGPRETWLTPINSANENAWTVLTQARAAAAVRGTPGNVDVAALADSLASELGPDLGKQLVAVLGKKLSS